MDFSWVRLEYLLGRGLPYPGKQHAPADNRTNSIVLFHIIDRLQP